MWLCVENKLKRFFSAVFSSQSTTLLIWSTADGLTFKKLHAASTTTKLCDSEGYYEIKGQHTPAAS